MSDTTTVEIEVSSDELAFEVGMGILGRASQLYRNPDDDVNDVAEELRNVGQELIEDYDPQIDNE